MEPRSPATGRIEGEAMKRDYPNEQTAYAAYERMKADWVRANPEATPQEYQAAMRRIARECGI